jgi:hypothetical protein
MSESTGGSQTGSGAMDESRPVSEVDTTTSSVEQVALVAALDAVSREEVDPNLLRDVARSVPRMDSAAPSSEHVDLVAVLNTLSYEIVEYNRRIMAGEQINWSRLADQLGEAARACRRRVVFEWRDIGDSGSR